MGPYRKTWKGVKLTGEHCTMKINSRKAGRRLKRKTKQTKVKTNVMLRRKRRTRKRRILKRNSRQEKTSRTRRKEKQRLQKPKPPRKENQLRVERRVKLFPWTERTKKREMMSHLKS